MEREDLFSVLAGKDDIILMKDVSFGNEVAFKVLVKRHINVVSRTSFRILCDREDSEAVTVRVLVSLWNDVLEYDDRFTLEEWLLRKTVIYSRLRIMRRRVLRIFGVTSDLFVRAAPKVEDHDDFIVKQAWELFCRASAHMTPLQSAAYALCTLESLSTDDVSRIIGLSRLRVTIALQRASDKIRDELRHLGKEEDYCRFSGFLQKVAESLTDEKSLITQICAELDMHVF